jgi:hypothetical protein
LTDNNEQAKVIVPVKKYAGFQKGQSGNPRGRPKNSKNQMTLLKEALEWESRKQISLDIGEVLAKAILMAKEGNEAMIKLLVDKIIPSVRASDDTQNNGRERIQIVINKLPGAEPVAIQSKSSVIEEQ